MSDIVKFIEARLKEDEDTARATVQGSPSWQDFSMDGELRDDANAGTIAICLAPQDRAHIAHHDPARVLRDIEGRRAIVTECADNLEVPGGWEYEDTPKLAWFTLCGLAAAWSDHPDYDQDWALVDAEEES